MCARGELISPLSLSPRPASACTPSPRTDPAPRCTSPPAPPSHLSPPPTSHHISPTSQVSLEKVDLGHCDHLTAPHIYGPHLAEINLSGCSRLGDAALEELCGGCPSLRRLNICGCLQLRSPRIESRSLETLNCELLPPEIVASARAARYAPPPSTPPPLRHPSAPHPPRHPLRATPSTLHPMPRAKPHVAWPAATLPAALRAALRATPWRGVS